MFNSVSFAAAQKWKLTKGFTKFHGRLLDLCMNPPTKKKIPHLENKGTILTVKDIDSLLVMVEQEFVASFTKELEASDVADDSLHAFDVYLMQVSNKATIFRNRQPNIAVCVPLKSKLVWWNGGSKSNGGALWPMEPKSHVRKVASLSGSARVLQALWTAKVQQSQLVSWAMQRMHLCTVPPTAASSNNSKAPSNLNASQQRAVDAISGFRSGFFCIQGPPGCGKTTTMVQMILRAMKHGKVVVTAPSNAAVANIALKLYEKGEREVAFPNVVVFGSNCDKSVQFLEPNFRSKRYRKFRRDRDNALDAAKNGRSSHNQKPNMDHLLKKLGQWLHLDPPDWTMGHFANVCPNIPLDQYGMITRRGRKILCALLTNASVVFCTLNNVGSYMMFDTLKSMKFHTLMLDEGGQCTEAEFFLATTSPGIQRIVVMGDPQQLPPTVINPKCAQAGYGQSFLGQVYKVSPNAVHLLDTQYRMDPAILRFPNQTFYENRIRSGENVHSRTPLVHQPFQFVDISGQGKEENDQFSWKNQYEARAIAGLLRSDPDICRLLQTNQETTIIIISPYKSQMKLLEHQVKLPAGAKGSLRINTVDSFQGQEGDIVIVSTVRTTQIGFVDNAQRLNVALTRAKRILRVIGDQEFFESLGGQSTLRALVAYVEDMNNSSNR